MIRVVCICGKSLRARDESSLRNAVCPSCGCPVSKAPDSAKNSKSGQKPLTMKDGPLGGMNYSLVPLWEEGQSSTKDNVPRYQVVLVDESNDPSTIPLQPDGDPNIPVVKPLSASKKRIRPRRSKRTLSTSLEDTLVFPFYCGGSIFGMTLFVWFSFLFTQLMPVFSQSDSLIIKGCLLALPVLISVSYSGGFWLEVYATTMRGEDSVVVYQLFGTGNGQGIVSAEIIVQMYRCLVCFFTGPAWILALACYYWLYCGEIAFLDMCILAELILVALTYWVFVSLAVVTDGSFLSATPTGIISLFRRLGRRTSFIAVAATFLALMLIVGHAVLSLIWAETNMAWFPLLLNCLALQVGLSVLSRWLGVRCFLSDKERTVRGSKKQVAG